MIGIRLYSILVLIKLTVAMNQDGFCSFEETYTERVTAIKTFKVTVPYTRRCGVFSTRTCYDYHDEVKHELVSQNVQKSRIANKCCQGYIQIHSKCIPVCTIPCINGLCTEPDVCTCSTGYHKSNDNICIKNECDPGIPENVECPNGICTSNGTCLCNEGFHKEDADISSSGSKCVPICSEGCSHGTCVSPENCSCNLGYEAFNSSVCYPICQNACLFGECTEPNKCTCLEGYQLQNKSDHICDPVCSSDCINGVCVKPDLCLCDNGFEFSEDSKKCEAVCDIECVNSNCTSPNTCTCEIGFSPHNSTYCEILCENCTHGYCEEPNACQCNIGYHIEEGICVKDECTSNMMEDSCENGYCSDGICECDSGYEKNASKSCSPICSLNCINGYCVEPEVCKCHIGYDFSTPNVTGGDGNCTNCTSFTQWNICNAICEDCQNGTCDEGVCQCVDEYVQHPKNRGKCIHFAEMVYLENEAESNNIGITITMAVLGVVLVILVGGLAYRKYVIWSRESYTVAEIAYRKDEDRILL